MRQQWLAYVVVGLLSIGAGVAIAGLPDNTPVAATITTSGPTTVPDTTVPDTTVSDTTAPETTVPETTEPDTTEPETTEPDTTEPGSTDSVPGGLPARSELSVVAVNGASVDGAAGRAATRLEEIGYVAGLTLDGSEVFEFTTIYFVDGFDEAALRLAADLDLLDVFVAPIETSPAVPDLPADVELMAYIGIDRA